MFSLVNLDSAFLMIFVTIFLSTESAGTSTPRPVALCASSLTSEIWEGDGEGFTEDGGGLPNNEAKGLDMRATLAGLGGVCSDVPGRGGSGGLGG